MISIQPKKLLLSKWTAVAPVSKEKHFLVTKLVTPDLEGDKLEWIDLEAVHSKATRRMQWKELRDTRSGYEVGSNIRCALLDSPGSAAKVRKGIEVPP
jgi:tryptophan-rich hypothetical protein